MKVYKVFERSILASTIIAVFTGGASISFAQQTDEADGQEASGELEKIVVSARKREETIQESPLSIQAFSSDQLDMRGVEGISELTDFTPGLSFNGGTSRANSDFSVRGMTQTAATGDNRRDLVTVFVDGVPILGTPAGMGTEDLERVEVVKGPQSALFGRATFGGAISMITKTPDDYFGGHVAATLGYYGERKLEGSMEGALVENLLTGRLTYKQSDFDGFYKNALGGRLGASEQKYYSGTLNITPTDNLSVKLRYNKSDDYDGEAATTMVARYDDYNCGPFTDVADRLLLGLPAGVTLEQTAMRYCGEIKAPTGPIGINLDNVDSTFDLIPLNKHGMWMDKTLFSATTEWTFLDGYTATLILSDQDHKVEALQDFERTSVDTYQNYTINEQSQQTFELRVESPFGEDFSWMLGVSRLDADFMSGGGFIYGSYFGFAAGGPFGGVTTNTDNTQTDSIFGSVSYDLSENINLSVEARRQFDQITSGVGSVTEFTIETPSTLPRVLLRWEMDKENHFYLNYAKGNQPTQGYSIYFQLTEEEKAIARANGVNASAPEATVNNYEMGWKHYSADGTWYLNSSMYYLEWRGRQSLTSIQVDINGDGEITLAAAPAGEVFNVVPFVSGDSNTVGIELDGAYLLTPDFTVGGSASYADTEITKALSDATFLSTFGVDDAKGQDMPLVAKLSGAAFAQYNGVMMDNVDWYIRADATYLGKRYTDITNLSWLPARTLVNLRAGVYQDSWSASLYINNVFDDDTPTWARSQGDSATDPYFFSMTAVEIALARKRQIGATVKLWF